MKNHNTANLAKYTIILLSLSNLNLAKADQRITLTQKQSYYKSETELVTKNINPSKDNYDSFRDMNINKRAGITIEIPINSNGSGSFITQNGFRTLPVSFECDYQKGETKGEVSLSYQDPRNLYGRIHSIIEAQCIPLTEKEQVAQIETENELARIAEKKLIAEEQAQLQREAERKERVRLATEKERSRKIAEAQEKEIRNSPQFKQNESQKTIKQLQQQIEATQQRINEEKKIGMISGYVNAAKLHELGSFIVSTENEIQRQWKIYKENGGKAKTHSEITQ